MKQLLSYKALRLLKIAETITVYENTLTFDKIKVINDCSSKTVLDDLNYMQENWNHLINFEIKKYGIKGNSTSVHDLMIFKCEVFHREIKIQFMLNLYLNPNLTIQEHAKQLNYSESHLRRQLNPINNFLQQYSNKIVFNPETNGYFVQSDDEILTCMMLTQIIKVSLNRNLLPELNQEDIKISDSMPKIIKEIMPESEKLDIEIFYRVILLRTLHGNYSNKYTEELEKTFFEYYALKEDFDNITLNYANNAKLEISQKDIDTSTRILVTVANKANFVSRNIDNFMNRYDYFYRTFKNQSKDHVQFLEDHFKHLGKQYNINFSNFLPELIFHTYTHVINLRQFVSFSFGVYSDLGIHHSNSLIKTLYKRFPYLEFNHYEENADVDFIISTKDLANLSDNEKVIKVSDLLTLRDISTIYTAIYGDNT